VTRPSEQIALLPIADGTVLGCRSGIPGVADSALESAVFRLVGAVYESEPGQAHRCLRRRIYTNTEPNEAERAVVRVAAGKIGLAVEDDKWAVWLAETHWLDDVADRIATLYNQRSELALPHVQAVSPTRVARALDDMVRSFPRDVDVKRAEQDRPLAAALLNPAGTAVLAARNTAGRNKTRHAEVNLLGLAEAADLLPLGEGWLVVTTLSPCKMCAALLVAAFERPGIARVRYLELDHGKLARDTALDRLEDGGNRYGKVLP